MLLSLLLTISRSTSTEELFSYELNSQNPNLISNGLNTGDLTARNYSSTLDYLPQHNLEGILGQVKSGELPLFTADDVVECISGIDESLSYPDERGNQLVASQYYFSTDSRSDPLSINTQEHTLNTAITNNLERPQPSISVQQDRLLQNVDSANATSHNLSDPKQAAREKNSGNQFKKPKVPRTRDVLAGSINLETESTRQVAQKRSSDVRDKPRKKQRSENVEDGTHMITTCDSMLTLFARFRKMIKRMRVKPSFEVEFKEMIGRCRVNEIDIKNRIITCIYNTTKPDDSYTNHLSTAVQLDDKLIEFFASVIRGNHSDLKIRSTAKFLPDTFPLEYLNQIESICEGSVAIYIEDVSDFSSNLLFLNHWTRAKECISILKERYKEKTPECMNGYLDSNLLLSNEPFLALIEDSVARLASDLRFRYNHFRSSRPVLPLGSSMLNYLTATTEILKYFVNHPNDDEETTWGAIRVIEMVGIQKSRYDFRLLSLVFKNLLGQFTGFEKIRSVADECEMFAMIMFTRCRVLHEVFCLTRKMLCPIKARRTYVNLDGDLPLLLLYTFLDFKKVEEFGRERYC